MGFNTFPCNPYPISTEELNKGNNDLNARVDALESDVSDLNSQKANQITIAPAFNPETSYEVGDLVYYNGLSYKCVNSHQGEWDADDFVGTTIANELKASESGALNYSTTEQKTGRKWIDGRDIYVKTFNAGALPTSGNVTIQNDIVNFAAVINVETTGISSDGYSFSNDGLVMNYASAASLVFRVTFDATGYNGYVTVYYIKTT